MTANNLSLIPFLFLLLAGQARADEWTSKDTAWEATYLLLHIADWGQTLYIAEHPDQYYETNIDKIIGEHPTRGSVNTYFLFMAIAHPLISYNLPTKFYFFGLKINPRFTFQFISMAEKAYWVNHNYRIGIKFDF